MESLVDRLNARAGEHVGTGGGLDSGPFDATITLTPLLGALGTSIHYRAVAPDGEKLHEEHSVLARDMVTGRLTLFVLCDELSGVGQLGEVADGVLNNGAGNDGFELQIEIQLDAALEYTWSWAPPGEALTEQSKAVVRIAT